MYSKRIYGQLLIHADLQIPDMIPLPDSDTVSPQEDHSKSGEAQVTLRPPKVIVVPYPPEHESTLKSTSKYFVQYIPVKQTKPSNSNRVTDARILTSEECA